MVSLFSNLITNSFSVMKRSLVAFKPSNLMILEIEKKGVRWHVIKNSFLRLKFKLFDGIKSSFCQA